MRTSIHVRRQRIATRGKRMLPTTLIAFQRKGRWAYWHITSGSLLLLCDGLPHTHHLSDTDHSSALRVGRYRFDIRSNCRSSNNSCNKHDRKRSQMLQGGGIAIREHVFSCERCKRTASIRRPINLASPSDKSCPNALERYRSGSATALPDILCNQFVHRHSAFHDLTRLRKSQPVPSLLLPTRSARPPAPTPRRSARTPATTTVTAGSTAPCRTPQACRRSH